jgi:tetratricopeptide (TPR) repeat protein
MMFDFEDFEDFEDSEDQDELFSEAFIRWDDDEAAGVPHGYFEPDELCEIIETYFTLEKTDEAQAAIKYAVKMYPDNEFLIFEVMDLLYEYELWNYLLTLTIDYRDVDKAWVEAHRIASLLHLGMEEDAFGRFGEAKKKYAHDKESIIYLYEIVSETLKDIDLYESAVLVVKEILPQIHANRSVDLRWIMFESYLAMGDKKRVLELGEQIAKSNPMSAETWSHLGSAYKEINEIEKAIEALEFAVTLGKDDALDIIHLIYAYKENGNFLKALEKTDEYIAQSPDDYFMNLLGANISLEIEDWERALVYTGNALKIDPGLSFLYIYKSRCLLHLGEIKKAINILKEGLKYSDDETGEIKKQLEKLRRDYPEYYA